MKKCTLNSFNLSFDTNNISVLHNCRRVFLMRPNEGSKYTFESKMTIQRRIIMNNLTKY